MLERRLLDPDAAALDAALRGALPLEDRRRSWCEALRARPEGRLQGGPPGRMAALSWWTDPAGRRHVLVVSGELDDVEDLRPPLAHVYPERLFARRAGGVTAWLAACSCGAVGEPAALGWM